MHEAAFSITVVPPFRLGLTVWVLRRRDKNVIDRWDGKTYSRVLVLEDLPVLLVVAQGGSLNLPRLSVTLRSHVRLSPEHQAAVRAMLQTMLGLSVDVRPFLVLAATAPELRPLAKKFNGVRPPRFPTLFEALVNAVSCQQISLDAGIALLNRFTETYGLVFSDELNTAHAFPRPEDVFDVPEGDLRQLGFSHQKARAIKEAAYAVASGSVQPGQLELMSNERALVCLRAIHGIGRWSAEYVLLRGLGRLDVFPGDDIGGQNNVQILLGLMTRPDYEQLKELSASWQPYAGFVYFHLLLNKLHGKGSV